MRRARSGQSRYRNLWEHYYGLELTSEAPELFTQVRLKASSWLSTPPTSCVSLSSRRISPVGSSFGGQDELDTLLADPRITEKKMPILPRAQPFAVASWVEVPE